MSIDAPEVTLAITPTCPHCPGMLEVLNRLVKQGDIGTLHIINIAVQQDYASRYRIRSVPWLRIGPFVLQGLHTQQEIQAWLSRSRSKEGISEYITEMLGNGALDSVSQAINHSPETIRLFIPMICDDQTNINVRLGMGAIIEELAGQPTLQILLPELIDLLSHDRARVRADAAHFLSFINSSQSIPALQKCLTDPDADVREIAQESLESITPD